MNRAGGGNPEAGQLGPVAGDNCQSPLLTFGTASLRRRGAESCQMPNPARLLLRVPVPWVFVLAYLAGLIPQHYLHHFALTGSAASMVRTIGLALFGFGAVIAGSGLLLFHRASTTTTPGEFSRCLVNRGPYRFTRNPMYVGLTLAYLGEAGILAQVGPLALLPLVLVYLNWTVIPLEESRLAESFGAAYDDYRSRVRRWV